jgi:multiple sugar transport system permease protein
VITPMVPMAIAWKWIFDARIGILNYLLSWFGIPAVGWLTSPNVAIWSIIIMSVWKVLGYNMVLLLVGLKNIPASLYEAAAIDGAFGWRLFRRITLPLLRPILLFVIVVSTINAYNVFTQVYVMTQGSQAAPGAQLRVLVTDIYQNGFQFFKMGYASAEAVVLTLIILALTLVQFKVIRVDEGA